MGVPIDRTYPAANVVLRHKIEQKGCVISEYPPRSEGVGPNGFLQRNRLIAALSSALLVVEAQEKSGTMSTVSHAERYGKPVFAVPGSIYRPIPQAQTAFCGTAERVPCVLLLTCLARWACTGRAQRR